MTNICKLQQRFTSSSRTGKQAVGGYEILKFQTADVIFDGGIGGNIPANTGYMLNCDLHQMAALQGRLHDPAGGPSQREPGRVNFPDLRDDESDVPGSAVPGPTDRITRRARHACCRGV